MQFSDPTLHRKSSEPETPDHKTDIPVPPIAAIGECWGIVGYHGFTDRARFNRALDVVVKARGYPVRVVSGGAAGADTLAREWAAAHCIELLEHCSKTLDAHGFKVRNALIVRDSTSLVAFLSTNSHGTHDAINRARLAKIPVTVIQVD
jgi:hypothetical protein